MRRLSLNEVPNEVPAGPVIPEIRRLTDRLFGDSGKVPGFNWLKVFLNRGPISVLFDTRLMLLFSIGNNMLLRHLLVLQLLSLSKPYSMLTSHTLRCIKTFKLLPG